MKVYAKASENRVFTAEAQTINRVVTLATEPCLVVCSKLLTEAVKLSRPLGVMEGEVTHFKGSRGKEAIRLETVIQHAVKSRLEELIALKQSLFSD